jgi:DNA polymerase III delta prime subunit
MSASDNNVNNNPSNPTTASNPTAAASDQPSKKTTWNGRSLCSIDRITWAFGIALIITGIVLFVLKGIYGFDLFTAGVTTSSLGGGIFFLGLLTHCCLQSGSASKFERLGNKAQSKSPSPTISIADPVPLDKDTRTYFEENGFFGVSDDLIDTIDNWRAYRCKEEGFDFEFDAGFILYGPPGTGKTKLAQHIAKLLGGTYHEQQCGSLKSPYLGETDQKITKLFKEIPENEFRVITIDEIDGLLPRRETGGGRHAFHDDITSHFLGTVEGAFQKKPRYILIGTTNRIEDVDTPAIRHGRLGSQFEISNPDKEVRAQIFNFHLKKIASDEGWDGFAEVLAEKTENFSCANIVGLINEVQKTASRNKTKPTRQNFLDKIDKVRNTASRNKPEPTSALQDLWNKLAVPPK